MEDTASGKGYYNKGATGRSDLQRKVRGLVHQIGPQLGCVQERFAEKWEWAIKAGEEKTAEQECAELGLLTDSDTGKKILMKTALDVAAYILSKQGAMTAMKLQKLVSYAQAWSLLKDVLLRLVEFESNAWNEILRTGGSKVERDRLSPAARGRLSEIEQDDVDELISYRVHGRTRVWCIPHANIMRLLWWDPDHQVCPSLKNHT